MDTDLNTPPETLELIRKMFDQTDAQRNLMAAMCLSEDVIIPTEALGITRDSVLMFRPEGDLLRIRSVRLTEFQEMCEQGFLHDAREVIR